MLLCWFGLRLPLVNVGVSQQPHLLYVHEMLPNLMSFFVLLCFWLCNVWGLPHFVWLLTTTLTYLYSIVCCLLFIVLYENCASFPPPIQWTTNDQFYLVALSWIVLQYPIKDPTDLHWHCVWPLGVKIEHDTTYSEPQLWVKSWCW